ncbi:hypothetical protein [Streptomyces sp. SP18BB07]|uniref:hypothetical protein n=1 Tax=Streptomyces sp. SP18BB07 TaxID=3002522 RepID=UPI002E77883A|nr:hypothetical protein [Streptomyces sp. SP18BB07]MEE1757846.1 hypothetical protein [Streptomyces sp. SP18BB07]
MTPGTGAGTGTVHGFWARKLLVGAGVDPDDLQLDVHEHVDRGVALTARLGPGARRRF